MPRAPVGLGTTFKCSAHGRLAVAVLYRDGDQEETRMQHSGPGDRTWCDSKRYTRRVIDEVDRDAALAVLGKDEGS